MDQINDVGGVSGQRLKQLVGRIEDLIWKKDGILEDIREVFAEAKAAGFNVKIMRQIIKLRGMDYDDRKEQEALEDMYKSALGMS